MIRKIIEILKNNKKFLITAHMNLEGDALGAQLAMYCLLKHLKKQAYICDNDPVPRAYSFLPHVKKIRTEVPDIQFDAALVLDCSDSFRTGMIKNHLSRARYIVNIDHHISNTFFGDVNWVDPYSSSACEIVYRLCKKMGIMDRQIALCLYTGIFTDTGNFTYANTTKRVHKIASELIEYNISPHKIDEHLHSFCDMKDLDLIGSIVKSLKVNSNGKIVWAVIQHWPEKEYDLTEIIFSIMRLLHDVEVFVLFKKVSAHRVRVNLRSRSRVDVNRVAKFFGGGGHKRASGATVDGTLPVVEKQVISFIRRFTNGRGRKS
ncbi:MAG: bifunctional oligoribonuclease/PAP phosphatase NrnA [Candidatus Omnitrophica bacterium]|nr:bifunctional oligoribonuclease/PAP phosphatase NrnA [Candidatus Omnitrophota bacterium]